MLASRRALSLVVSLLLVVTGVVQAEGRAGPDSLYPDPTLTPGAAFQDVTADQVCEVGYTRRVRNVSAGKRAQVYAEYGIEDVPGADEVDHFIPLELGGSNDIANLWPEPYDGTGAHEKDRVENYLHDQVCGGGLTLADAQQRIVADWYAVYLELPRTSPAGASGGPASVTEEGVSFANVAGGPPGGRASVSIQTAPGATCSVQYVTPSGTPSAAQGQGPAAAKTAAEDGTATWEWDIGPATKAGLGSVTATCSTGTGTTPIPIG